MHCVLLLGEAGARVGRSLVWAACAGLTGENPLHLMVVDPARQADAALAAQLADYERVRQAMAALPMKPCGFRTPLTLHAWPDALPEERASLHALAQENPADTWLVRALFDGQTARKSLREGLPADAAAAVFAALTDNADGALAEMLSAMETAAQAGEEVRVLLCGALHETAAAGIPALARLIRAHLAPGQMRMGAVLLMPSAYAGESADAAARAALRGMKADMDAAWVLGMPEEHRTEPSSAHLTDWLAAHCLRAFFAPGAAPEGLFTCRTAEGTLDWRCFGADAEAYRAAWGGLIRTAAAFRGVIAPMIRRGLTEPKWLRDRMVKWYAAYFGGVRKMDASVRETALREMETLLRLSEDAMAWLAAVLESLPPALCHAEAIEKDRHDAEENFRRLLEAAGQLEVLRREAADGLAGEKTVHRRDVGEDQAEQLRKYMERLEKTCQALRERQNELDERIGGAAAEMVRRGACAKVTAESEKLHAQAAEAGERIERAAQVAAPEEQHRVADARIKLRRMERYLAQVDAQLALARREQQQASLPDRRRRAAQRPQGEALPTTGLFAADALAFWRGLPAEGISRRQQDEAETFWARLVQPEMELSALLNEISEGTPAEHSPAALWNDLMKLAGKGAR